jgi:N-acetylmuramoyl-L-alanine amidase
MWALTAAHRSLPFGTLVEVRNLENGQRVTVKINDRGPFLKNRVLDLSRAAAEALGVVGPGTALVELVAVGLEPLGGFAFTVQVGAFREAAAARELAERLRATLGLQVVLTRDEDVAVALDARSALANQQKADLFLSVHLNATVAGRARGAETYFLSLQATDERAAGLAATENLTGGAPASPGSEEFDLQLLLWDLAQSRHLASSQRLATFIQEELNRALELPDRGVKQAPFRVLTGAAMPAVLVELGFLSNAEEEKRLRDPVYRSGLAETLVRAVARFKSELEGAGASAGADP